MPVVNYWSHVPHLRTTDEVMDFGPGKLWQVPFEVWDYLVAGAFSDHERVYEATQPVFFYIEADVDWPILVPGEPEQRRNIELKKPSFSGDDLFERMGAGFLTWFVSQIGWAVQAALTLAAPASAPGSMRSSMTLCAPDDGYYFDLGQLDGVVARVQGDADHEWLLMPESAGEPLPKDRVEFGSALYGFADAAHDDADLAAALDALMLSAQPTLGYRDQLVLATIALEALLLPEARSDLAATFRNRLTALLDGGPELEEVARTLYDARSAALHGSEPRDHALARRYEELAVAQQAAAAAILAIGPAVLDGEPLESIRAGLDRGERPAGGIAGPPIDSDAPPALRTGSRLTHAEPSSTAAVAVPGGVMHANDGEYISWSPLIGLGSTSPVGSRRTVFFVDSLDSMELMEIEERDIRRDFLAKLAAPGSLASPHAVLGLPGTGSHELGELEHRRTDAVAALRLAGFWRFVDPSLLGWYIYEGSTRIRIPTVLRQSVLGGLAHEPTEFIGEADQGRVEEMASLLQTYREEYRDPGVDDVLGELLRAHPNPYLPGEASAALLLGIVEDVLGRFRPKSDPVQLEDLAAAVSSDEAAAWFQANGRSFRNAVAHGRWKGTHEVHQVDDENRLLVAVAVGAMRQMLQFIVDQPEALPNPAGAFVDHLASRL